MDQFATVLPQEASLSLSPTCTIPCRDDFPGPLHFETFLDSTTAHRKSWVVSTDLIYGNNLYYTLVIIYFQILTNSLRYGHWRPQALYTGERFSHRGPRKPLIVHNVSVASVLLVDSLKPCSSSVRPRSLFCYFASNNNVETGVSLRSLKNLAVLFSLFKNIPDIKIFAFFLLFFTLIQGGTNGSEVCEVAVKLLILKIVD